MHVLSEFIFEFISIKCFAYYYLSSRDNMLLERYNISFCLQAENRRSSSTAMMRYSHSQRRDRHSHSHCYSNARQHGFRNPLPFNSKAKRGGFSPTDALRFYALFAYLNFSTEGKPRTDARVRPR